RAPHIDSFLDQVPALVVEVSGRRAKVIEPPLDATPQRIVAEIHRRRQVPSPHPDRLIQSVVVGVDPAFLGQYPVAFIIDRRRTPARILVQAVVAPTPIDGTE